MKKPITKSYAIYILAKFLWDFAVNREITTKNEAMLFDVLQAYEPK